MITINLSDLLIIGAAVGMFCAIGLPLITFVG